MYYLTFFFVFFSVEMEKESGSLFSGGLPPADKPYEPIRYCECDPGARESRCGYALDVNYCDIYQGEARARTCPARTGLTMLGCYGMQRGSPSMSMLIISKRSGYYNSKIHSVIQTDEINGH